MCKLARHPVGHPATSRNPETQEVVSGQILDEVWVKEPNEFSESADYNDGWREPAFLAQLIEWPGRHRRVRITYYLRPGGAGPDKWYFGGQYSPDMSLEEFHQLIAKLQQKNW